MGILVQEPCLGAPRSSLLRGAKDLMPVPSTIRMNPPATSFSRTFLMMSFLTVYGVQMLESWSQVIRASGFELTACAAARNEPTTISYLALLTAVVGRPPSLLYSSFKAWRAASLCGVTVGRKGTNLSQLISDMGPLISGPFTTAVTFLYIVVIKQLTGLVSSIIL